MRQVLALAALLGLAACAAAVGPNHYLLSGPGAPPAEIPDGPTLGLREIRLPLYARRPQMATLAPGGEIVLADDHRWAEEPQPAATRLVARRLSAALGRPVVAEPWPPAVEPTRIVTVEVDYFAGPLDGPLRLSGQLQIASPRGGAATTESFEIAAPAQGVGYAALAERHGRALGRLAETIAEAVAASGR